MELTSEQERRVLALFGKDGWRDAQRDLLALALRGENALGVLPTGHGKSLCYQAAAVLLGGVSVVVSPLIALMRDQSEGLAKLGIPAARFDSTLEDDKRAGVLRDVASGALRLLFVAPESLENHALQEALSAAPLSLFVVDEVSLIGIEAAQQQSSTLFGTGNLLEDLITFVRAGHDNRLILISDSA